MENHLLFSLLFLGIWIEYFNGFLYVKVILGEVIELVPPKGLKDLSPKLLSGLNSRFDWVSLF